MAVRAGVVRYHDRAAHAIGHRVLPRRRPQRIDVLLVVDHDAALAGPRQLAAGAGRRGSGKASVHGAVAAAGIAQAQRHRGNRRRIAPDILVQQVNARQFRTGGAAARARGARQRQGHRVAGHRGAARGRQGVRKEQAGIRAGPRGYAGAVASMRGLGGGAGRCFVAAVAMPLLARPDLHPRSVRAELRQPAAVLVEDGEREGKIGGHANAHRAVRFNGRITQDHAHEADAAADRRAEVDVRQAPVQRRSKFDTASSMRMKRAGRSSAAHNVGSASVAMVRFSAGQVPLPVARGGVRHVAVEVVGHCGC